MLAIKTLPQKAIIFRREMHLMGDQFEISVVSDNPDWADERIDDAIAEISRVERLLSADNHNSIVNEINRNAGIAPVKVSGEVFRLIDRSLQISELTYGVFDITYYTTDRDQDLVNDAPVKMAVKTAPGYKNVVLDAKAQTVLLKEKGMRLGFGANGKGYAADRAKFILQMQGVSSGIINAGGNLLTWGAQPDNEPWTVATADPSQKGQPFADAVISNMAIATIENTGKYKPVINKKYLGNISPKKGFPVSGIKNVSMISTTAELAYAMATPVLSIGINAGLYLINQLNQVGCVVVDDHERIYTSKDIKLA